ncbi:MAG: hypothetical protein RLZZ628_2027 [Bacteroidota bacterium]|jgi:hypothetical protein
MQLYKGQPLPEAKKELLNFLRDTFPQIGREFIQPSKLRGFGELKNNSSTINIYFQDAKSVVKSAELLLAPNRFFITESMSIGIALIPLVNGVPQYGDRKVVTYPYPSIFTKTSTILPSSAVTTDDTVLKSIECFYNGKFSLKVENFDYLEGSPINMFKVDPNNRPDIVNYGHHQVDLHTTLIMSGGKEQKLILEIPSDGDYSNIAMLNANTMLRVEIELDGYVIICNDDKIKKYVSEIAEGK